jgi:hypothetical protein
VLPTEFAGERILRERFGREARLISSLNTRTSARCSTSANRTASRTW